LATGRAPETGLFGSSRKLSFGLGRGGAALPGMQLSLVGDQLGWAVTHTMLDAKPVPRLLE